MQEIEITVGRLLSIFWALLWRAMLGALVAGAVTGFVIGFVMGAFGSSRENVAIVTSVVGLVCGFVWWAVALRMALKKQYEGFRIALIAR